MSTRGGRRPGSGRKKGSPNKRTREREELIARAAKCIESVLPDAFKGDAHAFLMAVYKDPALPVRDRLAAATAAIAYEKPKLASVEYKGDGENPLEIVTRIELVPVEPSRSAH